MYCLVYSVDGVPRKGLLGFSQSEALEAGTRFANRFCNRLVLDAYRFDMHNVENQTIEFVVNMYTLKPAAVGNELALVEA
jgi:hypothetical protein